MLAGGTATLYRNEDPIAQWTHTYNTVLTKLVIGEEIGGFGFVDMDVAAALIYNRALSATERASVGAYLRSKYLTAGGGNTPPTVTITSPANNATFTAGSAVGLAASASDTQDGTLTAALTWTSDRDGALGSGGSVTVSTLSVGTHLLTAAVTDSGGLTASATRTITVTTGNTPPTVTITSPANNATFTAGSAVGLAASASDTQDGTLTAALTWTSDRDGALGSGGSVTVSTLSVGTHLLTAAVTDSGGLTASATRTITVTTGNTPPTVTITSPANNATFTAGSAVGLAASASDTQDGTLTAALTWTSDRDGALGSGGSVTVSTLSVGTHLLTAAVTDSGGLTASATRTITITTGNTPPTVTITSPANNATFTAGSAVGLAASASDTQDGTLTAALTWTSDRDGALGSGGSVTVSTLSVGTHLLTAAVTDSGGLTASATRTITMTTARGR